MIELDDDKVEQGLAIARRRKLDARIRGTVFAVSLVTLCGMAFVIGSVMLRGVFALRGTFDSVGTSFFLSVATSVVVVALASALAVPLGIVAGVEFAEIRVGSFVRWARRAADALSVVPSVVLGIFVYGTYVHVLHRGSLFAGAFALALTMAPRIAKTTEVAVRSVPEHLREAALALGATRGRSISVFVFPAARRAIVTQTLFAISRACGEASVLLFCLGTGRFPDRAEGGITTLSTSLFQSILEGHPLTSSESRVAAMTLVLLVLVLYGVGRFAADPRFRGDLRKGSSR